MTRRKTLTARLIAVLVGAASLFVSSSPTRHLVAPAWADELERAKKLFKQGEKFYKDEQFVEAAEAFTESYELSGRAELLYYIGSAWEKAGELVKAQQNYQRYLDELPDAPNADKIIDRIIDLQERIAEEMGRIEVSTEQEGLDVFVDGEGEARCQTPCMIIVKPGEHRVRVTPAEGDPVEESFSVAAGEKKDLAIQIITTRTGMILVRTDTDGGEVRVGKVIKPLPLTGPLELEEGRYPVWVLGGNDARWEGEVEITADETAQLFVPLQHVGGGDFSLKRVGSYTLISVGAGLLVGGLLMGRQARMTYDLLDQQQRAGAVDADLISQGKSQQRGANLLFISSGLTLAGGGGLLAWDMFGGKSDGTAPPSEDEADAGAEEDSADVELID